VTALARLQEWKQENRLLWVELLPVMAVVFGAFLVAGLALPVPPLHVHEGLGLSTFVVGLVSGSQFAASLVCRVWSGQYSDTRGPKRAVIIGLLAAAVSGSLYLLSLGFLSRPVVSVTILLAGRTLLGAAESFVITGAASWGLARADARRTGKVIAWVGMALWAAYAAGAPLGTALYAAHGFPAIALTTILIPLGTLALAAPLSAVLPLPRTGRALVKVAKAVWVPGAGMALASVSFGATTAFSSLLFAEHGWPFAWLAYSIFASAFILARVLFGHLGDRLGGATVAFVCVVAESAGQAMIWLAPAPPLALSGALLSGFGWSLVYPGFGLEAVRRAPAESRGLALGVYTAFLDLALGVASPALGGLAGRFGLRAVFLCSALIVLGGAGIALRLQQTGAASRNP